MSPKLSPIVSKKLSSKVSTKLFTKLSTKISLKVSNNSFTKYEYESRNFAKNFLFIYFLSIYVYKVTVFH